MSTNFHTPWAASVTQFTAAGMNPAIASLDLAITYAKNVIVHCDGAIAWTGATLSWASTLRFLFTDSAGLAKANSAATGSIALGDNQFAYVDLSETNNAVVTVQAATITTGGASNFKTYNRMVLGYRNSASDAFYPVEFVQQVTTGLPHVQLHAMESADDHSGFAAPATLDEVVTIATTSRLPKASGTVIHDLLNGLEQEATASPATTLNIDWTIGDTQYATLATSDPVNIRMTGQRNGHVYRLRLIQDATGSRTVSWADTIKWRGGDAPTLTTNAGYSDFVTLVRSNGTWFADVALNFSD
ncbi:MAG TPA: hypothetical protein PLR20_14850 [Syntrophales bacterium]|nr:hypothetical protein [Syntrophales bacterium]